jgi:hypothetical protein
VNEADGMIAVHMKGSTLFPNEVGRDQIRKVCFSEDEMTYIALVPTAAGKERALSTP